MPDPLITVEQLEARLVAWGATVPSEASMTVLIEDASSLVRQVARWTDTEPAVVPATIVTVVAQMVRRALENPGELTGENIGSYGWQAQQPSPSGGSIYVTRAERRIIREAAGRPAVISVSFDTGLRDPRSWSETD